MPSKKTGFENCIIYHITNSVNDDTYIGSSKHTKEKRFKQHMEKSYKYPKRPLYKSFIEVGRDNVNMDILEEFSCDNEYDLVARESHWIKKYKPNLNKCKINKVSVDEETQKTVIHTQYITKKKQKEIKKEDPEVTKVKQDIKNMTSEQKTEHFNKLRDQLLNQFSTISIKNTN